MSDLRKNAPLHVREGHASDWHEHFAWLPVRSEQGNLIWLRKTWRRWFYPPIWFIPPAPERWSEYSDERRGFWDAARH